MNNMIQTVDEEKKDYIELDKVLYLLCHYCKSPCLGYQTNKNNWMRCSQYIALQSLEPVNLTVKTTRWSNMGEF